MISQLNSGLIHPPRRQKRPLLIDMPTTPATIKSMDGIYIWVLDFSLIGLTDHGEANADAMLFSNICGRVDQHRRRPSRHQGKAIPRRLHRRST